jgi:serine protease SohB
MAHSYLDGAFKHLGGLLIDITHSISWITFFLLKIICILIFLYGLYRLINKGKSDSCSRVELQRHQDRYAKSAKVLLYGLRGTESLQKKIKQKWRNHSHKKNRFLYVIDFEGDLKASQTEQLSETVTVLLEILQPDDKVLVRLKSSGGFVPNYGYAACQLLRLKNASWLTFAIVGSIGVVGIIPHVYPWLKKQGIEVQEHTAGHFKRSLSPWTQHTPEKIERYQEELQRTHELFKTFVHQYRPCVSDDVLQSGEYCYAAQSLGHNGLVDTIMSSEDFIAQHVDKYDVIYVNYDKKSSWWQKVTGLGLVMAQKIWGFYA